MRLNAAPWQLVTPERYGVGFNVGTLRDERRQEFQREGRLVERLVVLVEFIGQVARRVPDNVAYFLKANT